MTGLTLNSSSVVVSITKNYTAASSDFYPSATFDYCGVEFAYSHNGLEDDEVLLMFWLPAPSAFRNRYLSTGGGSMSINSGNGTLPAGVMNGAVAAATDGGFGSFGANEDDVFLLANGTINYEALYMFGYKAHHEMSVIGKAFTRNFFQMSASAKLYAYYLACSEGGREGWSQIQRYDDWDGAVVGAPAFRYGFQQVQHLWSDMVEKEMDYYPPPCELQKIMNMTLAACDGLDGRVDGVVSRTDLCGLEYNLTSTIGEPYYCASASSSSFTRRQVGGTTYPAQNGTVTAQGVAVAQQIIDGLKDSQGRQVYLSYQIGASFEDAETAYDDTTDTWEVSADQIGTEFVSRFLFLEDTSDLADFANVTNDIVKDWMYEGWTRYLDSLHTTWPDLTPFHANGGKIIHYHGEADNSVPTASSVHYYESVRSVMYQYLSYNESIEALNDWYRLFIVPGAAHCSTNDLMPNGPFPRTNLATLIDWVENGVEPVTLNATVMSGDYEGEQWQLCAWPLRPIWSQNGTVMDCEYDQASINTWLWDFDAFPITVW
ncbi:hypothetical protein ASPZODRAFT_125919 [Penicilliopsis zonata CBS 506.65]|uniref:Carboxylic ester hydrolase n=1 Tax=Penicilliopsis zonata CBS 506.65 TaxID=1073090 RepID=A0A1L9S4W3_9EURO|nr:hypothetical protein ASPZODRAFT_125919 [Penicilliopsis zonata CBS 506.65]OJJ42197.1 hypothetical protein ASPZODRAFT_125919 [Penicilliopsis zonata CBS 506.65]